MQVSSLGREGTRNERDQSVVDSLVGSMQWRKKEEIVKSWVKKKMSRIQWLSKGCPSHQPLSKQYRDRLVVAWQPQEANRSNFSNTGSVVDSAGSAFSLQLVERHRVQEQAHCRLN